MEITKAEVAAVELAVKTQEDKDLVELKSLELALVGGGCGDVAF